MANATKTTSQSREQVAAEITQQLLASLNAPRTSASWTDRLLAYSSDKIADAGNGVAELSAGFSAAADNYAVSRESAILRQKQRTAQKVAALVEKQLQFRGL